MVFCGVDVVGEIVEVIIGCECLCYECFLLFFGMLGNNVFFIGLFGMVLGIVEVFVVLVVNVKVGVVM